MTGPRYGRKLGKVRPKVVRDPRDADILEAQVQQGIIDFLEALWWKVYRVGQNDARRTQDEGVSDLLCFHPDWGTLFIESKRAKGGRQSDAQKQFQADVEAGNGRYLLAPSTETVANYLNELRRERRVAQSRMVH